MAISIQTRGDGGKMGRTRNFFLSEKRDLWLYGFYYVKCKLGCVTMIECKDLNHESLSLFLSFSFSQSTITPIQVHAQ